MTNPVHVEVHLGDDDLRAALAHDVRVGLASVPKELPPKWFYDDRGSALFDRITALPEYYPTRREREVLAARAATVAELTGADTLVELGSGTSEKTRLLLDAMRDAGTLRRFVGFDVCEPVLRSAGAGIAAEYPGIEVHCVVGDFEHHLELLPDVGRRLIAFLGGTIGNLKPPARAGFLAGVGGQMGPEDAFLLGTDLVKDRARLEAAYDDTEGVTAAFNRNVLSVLNRRLGADFVPERFEHVARYDDESEWVEMLLRSTCSQTVAVRALGRQASFGAGEEMRTEVSAKFRREGVEAELLAAGLKPAEWWTDSAADFAVSLAYGD